MVEGPEPWRPTEKPKKRSVRPSHPAGVSKAEFCSTWSFRMLWMRSATASCRCIWRVSSRGRTRTECGRFLSGTGLVDIVKVISAARLTDCSAPDKAPRRATLSICPQKRQCIMGIFHQLSCGVPWRHVPNDPLNDWEKVRQTLTRPLS